MQENIVIYAAGKTYNRFKIALDIQNACNPSGVAHELVRVIKDAMNDRNYTGTSYVREDPAVQLVIDKLHDLVGREDVWSSPFGNGVAERCQRLANDRQAVIDKQSAE